MKNISMLMILLLSFSINASELTAPKLVSFAEQVNMFRLCRGIVTEEAHVETFSELNGAMNDSINKMSDQGWQLGKHVITSIPTSVTS